jgi:hypothetical protein
MQTIRLQAAVSLSVREYEYSATLSGIYDSSVCVVRART